MLYKQSGNETTQPKETDKKGDGEVKEAEYEEKKD